MEIFRKLEGKNTFAKYMTVMKYRHDICVNIRMTGKLGFRDQREDHVRDVYNIKKKKKGKV